SSARDGFAKPLAFRKFSIQPLARPGARALQNPERFGRRIPVLEVHHIRRERSTAIQARPGAKLTQELNGVALTFLDPAKLCLARKSVRHTEYASGSASPSASRVASSRAS